MPVSANYRNIQTNEVKVSTIIQKSFAKQRQFLMDNAKELYEKYPINVSLALNYLQNTATIYPKKGWQTVVGSEPLHGFWLAMGVYDMIDQIKPQIQKTTEKGYKKTFRQFSKVLLVNGIHWDAWLATQYSNMRWELQLSNYKGTVTHTTKYNVVNTINNALLENKTRWELAKDIEKVSDVLFSPARAKTIAVTELGKAYEYGNWQPAKSLLEQGVKVKKMRLTCRDAKVRPEHQEAEALGWIDATEVYPSTGTLTPPWGVNCRCTIKYDFDIGDAITNLLNN